MKHQFIKIGEIVSKENDAPSWRSLQGVKVGCPICGQIRNLFENGNVDLTNQGNGNCDKHTTE